MPSTKRPSLLLRLKTAAAQSPLVHLLTVFIISPLAAFISTEIAKASGVHLAAGALAAVFIAIYGIVSGVVLHYLHFRLPANVVGIANELAPMIEDILSHNNVRLAHVLAREPAFVGAIQEGVRSATRPPGVAVPPPPPSPAGPTGAEAPPAGAA